MTIKNWKTTLCGVAALLGIAAKVWQAGHFDASTDGPIIAAAIGSFFAKDKDVSGIGRGAYREGQ
jgi:hypothetical protein